MKLMFVFIVIIHFLHVILPGSLSAMRLVTAATKYYPDKVERLSREFWMRVWSRVCCYPMQ